VSHTFILREVEALRGLGFEVGTVSVRRPEPAHLQGPAEIAAEKSTWYILPAARRGLPVLLALIAALRTPGRLTRTLGLAWRTAQPGPKGALYQIFYLLEALLLARHLHQTQVAHLHNHFASSSATVAMLAAELAGISYSYTLHGPADLYEPRRWHLREKTARAAFVACISHFARSQAMHYSDPVHWPKLKIVHCGVEPELYTRPSPPPQGGIEMLFVGRLAPVKGLRVLISALEDLLPQHPGLRLTLVGDGEDRAHLEAMAAPLGDAVRFVGYQSQDSVAGFLAGTDMLVLPSFAEGLPVVLMEAMASAKPVIATRVAGVAELVEDGKNGLLVHAGDRAGLIAAIARLAGDADLRASLGRAGRAKVREEFDIWQEAARIGALFCKEGGQAPRPMPLPGGAAPI